MKIDKDELKKSLTIEQVYELIVELGGEPYPIKGNSFISRTICHNPVGQGSYKLYYYDNGEEGIFHCYTGCAEGSFDIYELVRKQKTISTGEEWSLPKAIAFVAAYFGYSSQTFDFGQDKEILKDWEIFNNYERINHAEEQQQKVELRVFDDKILKFLPRPRITPWEEEGISREVMLHRGIAYDPKNQGIVIPHYDINDNLVGIRERTLIKEQEKNGKYRPAILNGQMYNHPLGFVNYNLNNSKENIKKIKKVIIFEGEKSCLKYASFFGEENDISIAVCGSSMTLYQFNLLLTLGVDEIIFAFDKQYQNIGDKEYKQWIKKLSSLSQKFRNYCKVSFIFDIDNLLEYKMSPIDNGIEIFLQLFKRRLDADGK